jgi:hypothetical protein
MTNGAYSFAQWQSDADPALWMLRLVSSAGERLVAMPPDRDCAAAALRACNGADVWMQPQMAQPHLASAQRERQRLGLVPRQRIEAVQIEGERNDMATPYSYRHDQHHERDEEEEPEAFASDPTVESARREALVASAAARAAAARAEIAEHERRRAEADAATRQFAAGGSNGAAAQFEALARLLAEQQRSADARMEMMLSRMAPQRRGLEELKETLGLFAAVRELMQDAGGAEPELDGPAAIVREVRQMLPDLVGAWRRPAAAVAPQRMAPQPQQIAPPPPEPAAAPLPAALRASSPASSAVAGGNQIASKRAREFVQRLAQEIAVGADPGAVADGLADGVALLPAPLRTALDAGQWAPAWDACQQYLEPDEREALQPWMESPDVQAWLSDFAAALRLEDDAAPAATITA